VTQSDARVALVTGAGRGIGRAVALELARAGFSLCLAARTYAELEETRRLTELPARRALIVLVDLAAAEAAENLAGAAFDHFGSIDVLVNNAGWAPPRMPLLKVGSGDLARMIAVNLHAPIALTRLAAAKMSAAGGGTIVNVASSAARDAPAGEAVYAAAKAGLVAFTHAAFAELRNHDVKLSVIVPGLVDTTLIPPNKRIDRTLMIPPEDVAGAVLQIVNSPPRTCPVEIVLEPQRDPSRGRNA
jgi:NADP-dependent 3-hydroxy acid dehydrogenase YdfG